MLRGLVVGGFAAALLSCGSDDGGGGGQTAPLAVVGAFPYELAELLERATVEERVEVDGKVFRIGTLGGKRVVLAMTGIGLVNATETTRLMIEHFKVSGVVMSGVAGSYLRIGDVAVPEVWVLPDDSRYAAHGPWLDVAEEVAAANIDLESCTLLPMQPSHEEVCLAFEPVVVVGGEGHSSDGGGAAFMCVPRVTGWQAEVFGCDVAPDTTAAGASARRDDTGQPAGTDPDVHASDDEESAAAAAEAAAHGVPFIAFRSVSDGEGDPLNLGGFPAQFYAYYRVAANNAAAATAAFLERL